VRAKKDKTAMMPMFLFLRTFPIVFFGRHSSILVPALLAVTQDFGRFFDIVWEFLSTLHHCARARKTTTRE
jgi:hypothetical protein